MTLKEALVNQGNSFSEADDIISSMAEDVSNGADPEECLEEYGLEPDYVFDLLNECS
jgi:hypothetical protein